MKVKVSFSGSIKKSLRGLQILQEQVTCNLVQPLGVIGFVSVCLQFLRIFGMMLRYMLVCRPQCAQTLGTSYCFSVYDSSWDLAR
jgi:hypothetical protein